MTAREGIGGPGSRDGRSVPSPSRGASAVEVVLVAGLVGLLALGGVAARRAVARHEAPLSARRFASELRLQRGAAIGTARSRGLVFRRAGSSWTVALHADGDGDGIRADDIRAGRDPLLEPIRSFEQRYGRSRPGFLPQLQELWSPPPGSRRLPDLVDPVRFGNTDTVTCNARGNVTSGTLYLTDGRERQLAVVVYGTTSRLRVWEWDVEGGVWKPAPGQ